MMNRNMMKQAQQLQKQRKMIVESIEINPDAVDPDDVEMLEDLVLSAVNGAMEKAQELASSRMGAITGGLNIPGLT